MPDALIHVVDDDAVLRRSVRFLLESVGWRTVEHEDGAAFLGAVQDTGTGCALVDVRMPGLSGVEVLHAMRTRGLTLPVVFLTGHGDVALAVQAMKDGAFDFIEKPYRDQVLLDAVTAAVRRHETMRAESERHDALAGLYALLTPREREVARCVARGLANKQIARELGISEKTVHVHRAKVMEKMRIRSAAELAQQLGVIEPDFAAGMPDTSRPGRAPA